MITGQVEGESKLRDFFSKVPRMVRAALRKEMDRIGILLAARMKEKLSGNVLKVRTGRLRRSITSQGREGPAGYEVNVGTNVVYAAAHEYGYQGSVMVPSHLRLVRKAWGRPVRNPTRHMVRAHAMRMRLPERSFARSALKEMEGKISDDLRRVLEATIQNAAPQG